MDIFDPNNNNKKQICYKISQDTVGFLCEEYRDSVLGKEKRESPLLGKQCTRLRNDTGTEIKDGN